MFTVVKNRFSFNPVSGNENASDSATANSASTGKRTKPKMPPYAAYVDLRTNYDEVLMKRFYEEMMIPNFPDPDGTNFILNLWLSINNPSIIHHIIILFRFFRLLSILLFSTF